MEFLKTGDLGVDGTDGDTGCPTLAEQVDTKTSQLGYRKGQVEFVAFNEFLLLVFIEDLGNDRLHPVRSHRISFDMFEDYQQRGEAFMLAVRELCA